MAQSPLPRVLIFICMAVALLLPPAAFADVEGEPKVIDARTIEINGQQIRLWGIDAPDIDQLCFTKKKHIPFRCGVVAIEKLQKLLSNQVITCKGDKKDEEGRLIAVCYSGRVEVNENVVLSGWGVADPKQTDKYNRAQGAAQNMRDGMWRSSFVMPWEWRAGNHEPPGKR
ncbi:MAG TPA: thermonuclease family protein [Sedimenticola sp.]|nr:thermonuclease family protein [Sedimenticola sp.]